MSRRWKWFAVAAVGFVITMEVVSFYADQASNTQTLSEPREGTVTTTVAPTTTTTTTLPATTTTRPQRVTTTTVPSPDVPLRVLEDIFVDQMQEFSYDMPALTWVDVASDAELLEWGYLICDTLDDVGVPATLRIALAAGQTSFGDEWNDYDEMLVPYGIGAATALCPWNEQAVIDWTDS